MQFEANESVTISAPCGLLPGIHTAKPGTRVVASPVQRPVSANRRILQGCQVGET